MAPQKWCALCCCRQIKLPTKNHSMDALNQDLPSLSKSTVRKQFPNTWCIISRVSSAILWISSTFWSLGEAKALTERTKNWKFLSLLWSTTFGLGYMMSQTSSNIIFNLHLFGQPQIGPLQTSSLQDPPLPLDASRGSWFRFVVDSDWLP